MKVHRIIMCKILFYNTNISLHLRRLIPCSGMAIARFFFTLFLFTGLFTDVFAVQIIHVNLSDNKIFEKPVSKFFHYFIDTGSVISIENVSQHVDKFKPWTKENIHFGTNPNPIWLYADINNLTNEDIILELGYPIIDSIDFYLVRNGQVVKTFSTGSSYPFMQREVLGNYFKFIIPPGQFKIYLRVRSLYNVQFPATMYSWKSLNYHNSVESVLQGIYIGLVLLIVLYNVFLFYSIRDSIYYWYVFHTIATALITLHLNGYTFKYLWPNFPIINSYEPLIFGLGIFTTLFSIKFLRPETFSPFWNRVLWGIFWVNVPVFILPFAGLQLLANTLVQLVGSIGCLLMLLAGIVLMLRGYKPAVYYVIAFTLLLVGVIISILARMNVLPNEPVLIHASQIGSAFDIVLLSIAVADRVNEGLRERKELKNRLFREAIEKENIIRQQNILLKEEVDKQTKSLKEANTALQAAAAELKAKNEYQNKLLTIIGHDLKGSLSNLTGLFDLYKDDPKNYDKRTLQLLNVSANDTMSIFQNLLVFSRINNDDLRPGKNRCSVATVVKRVISQIKQQANLKNITITDDDVLPDITILADEFYLEVILRNILVNAIKFTPENGRITVSAAKTPFNEAIITIRDTGVGMSADKVQAFFSNRKDEFTTVGTAGEKGTGIGRILIKELVEAMGGSVHLKSEQGVGTEFTLTFDSV